MGKYLFKVNNKDSPTNKVFSSSKSTIKNKKINEWFWPYFTNCLGVSIVNFEEINDGWKQRQHRKLQGKYF